jgi:hypothetical protein
VDASSSLARQDRWQDLADLLQPHWLAWQAEQERISSAEDPGVRGNRIPGWNWALARPLLEACLHLGRIQKGDTILETLRQAGQLPNPAELADLCRLAQGMGAEAWARKWLKSP